MPRSFFPSVRAALAAGLAVTTLLAAGTMAFAQDAPQTPAPAQQTTPVVTGQTTETVDANGQKHDTASASLSIGSKKKKTPKDERLQQTKDTKQEVKKQDKYNVLLGKDASLPDKQLYDKALDQEKKGHYDVARLDLQTLLNTYPDSQYLMRAKLAVADCWYREGGSAALAQAEQEYKDFITFFPNAPEAPVAQMRVGDIYFKQMDVPDRDYSKAVHAQEEYRAMLRQYPDAPKNVTDEARQKLREVQEMLATREAGLGAFYATHENWSASIARYQTVVDTYPQFSHMDDVLIGIGDAWEAQANAIRKQPLPPNVDKAGLETIEAGKSKLEQMFDGRAAAAYRKVVLEHAAAPHVEDAKERLLGMNLPVPTPTPEQVAASEALEGSRAQYTLSKRMELLFVHKPDTVQAARAGEPSLDDPAATVAPAVSTSIRTAYNEAFNIHPADAAAPAKPSDGTAPKADDTAASAPQPDAAAAPATLNDIGAAGQGASDGSTGSMTAAQPSGAPAGNSLGVEVLTPGVKASPASDLPAATGAPDANYGLKAVAPKDTSALPAPEKAAEAPDAVNEAAGSAQPTKTADAAAKGKKQPKPDYDKNDESSSKHPKKKGVDKLNPF